VGTVLLSLDQERSAPGRSGIRRCLAADIGGDRATTPYANRLDLAIRVGGRNIVETSDAVRPSTSVCRLLLAAGVGRGRSGRATERRPKAHSEPQDDESVVARSSGQASIGTGTGT
jgi:hypothetical protein